MITMDAETLTAEVAQLTRPEQVDEYPVELLRAARFTFRFGTLGDIFDEPDLTRAQFAGVSGSAWYLLGHWSTARNDPNPPPGASVAELACHPGCEVCQFLENVAGLRMFFETELCDECGGDVDVHTITTDPLGLPHTLCLGRWQRVGDGALAVDDVVDDQITDSYAARWVAPLAENLWAVVTRTYYVVRDGRELRLQRYDAYEICRQLLDGLAAEVIARAGTGHVLDSDDPASEDLEDLAVKSFAPDPGEWETHMPDSNPYANYQES